MILNLQALRAYAATLVLFHHGHRFYEDMGGGYVWFENISRWGFTGVDIFFVLSGYVIALSVSPRNGSVISPGKFLFRRFGRIYLGYWPFFFIALITASLFYPQFLADKKIFASAFLLTPSTANSVVSPAWSLTYELYFYALAAMMLALPMRFRNPLLVIWISAAIVKLLAIDNAQFASLDFFFSPFVFEFLAGILLFRLGTKIHKTWVLVLSVILLPMFVTLGVVNEHIWGIWRVLSWGNAAVCLVVIALVLEQKKILIADRFSVALGDASYTLYLSHTILLALFYVIGLQDWFVATGWVETGFFGYLAFIILSSMLFYRIVEHPLYVKYLGMAPKPAPGKAYRAE